MKHIGTQPIETERLILRRTRPEDAPAMFRNWLCDEKVTKFMAWQPYRDVEEASARAAYVIGQYADDRCYDWVIDLILLSG